MTADGDSGAVGSAFRELFRDERFGAEEGDPADRNRVELLRDQRDQLKQRRKRLISLRATTLLMSGSLILITPVLVSSTRSLQLGTLVGAYGAIFLLVNIAARQRVRELGDEIVEIDNEIDLLRIADDSPERRAQKLFQLHAIDLKRYYDQTLHQGTYIFWVGVVCILLGFGVVAITVWLLHDLGDSELSLQIVMGVLGGVGAVLANFIAVIYLRMYSETVASMTEFHTKLVGTHHLHFGNLLVAKISDDVKREEALRTMAQALAGPAAVSGDRAGRAGNGAASGGAQAN